MLCTQPPSLGLAGTPEAVAAELQQVQEAHNTVAQMGKRQLTIYAAVPEAAEVAQARRRLQGVQADVGTCGQLCQVRCLYNGCLGSSSKRPVRATGLLTWMTGPGWTKPFTLGACDSVAASILEVQNTVSLGRTVCNTFCADADWFSL